jgi:hypothetical protein
MPVQEPVGAKPVGAAEDFSAEDSVGATEAVVAPVADLPRRSERIANRPAVRYSPRSCLAQVPAAPVDYHDAMSTLSVIGSPMIANSLIITLISRPIENREVTNSSPRLLTYSIQHIAFRSYASPMIFCNYCLHIRKAKTRRSTPANLLDRTYSHIANLTTLIERRTCSTS